MVRFRELSEVFFSFLLTISLLFLFRHPVFYGSSDHVESLIPPNKRWFSQVRQDEAIISLLGGKRRGYFVDLACK